MLLLNKKTIILGVSLFALSSIALTSCSDDSGKSAYEIAVENGFDGTEDEWLESLKGDNGVDGKDGTSETQTKYELYTEAVANEEFDGTYMDFLKEIIGGDYSLSSLMNESCFSVVSLTTTWTISTTKYGPTGKYTEESESAAYGSGIFIDVNTETGDAYILTNYHMVYSNEQTTNNGISEDIVGYIYGYEYDEYAFEATYIGGSINVDLAVLKVSQSDVIKGSNSKAITFADSDTMYVGETVFKTGNDYGEGISVSSGEISLCSYVCTYTIGDTTINNRCIRATALHNGGSSGGGLFNEYGELIGIVACKVEATGAEGLCYSIPISVAEPLANKIISNYEKTNSTSNEKCMLGITTTLTNPYIYYNEAIQAYQSRASLIISEISSGSICEGILEVGDIITSATLGDKTKYLYNYYELSEFLYWANEGDIVTLNIERDGESFSVNIKLTNTVAI